jgi:hypothetical protein
MSQQCEKYRAYEVTGSQLLNPAAQLLRVKRGGLRIIVNASSFRLKNGFKLTVMYAVACDAWV